MSATSINGRFVTRRCVNAGLGTAIIAPVLGPLPAQALSDTPVKIGLIMSYSGQVADSAAQIDNGIRLYMKQHGDIVAGKKIEIIRKDTGGPNPEIAQRLAQELIVRDRADILAGFILTPEALGAGDISAEAKKLMVVMLAATSTITNKSPYIIRVSSTFAQNCEPLGKWAFKNGVKKAYTMVSDYAAGLDADEAFQRGFNEAGGEIIGSVRIPVANLDFSAFAQRAKDLNPEGIFVFVPGAIQAAAIAKALGERGLDPKKIKIMGQGELSDESVLRALGDAGIGIITALYYEYSHNSPFNKQFVAAYNAEFKRNPDFRSVNGYDGMHLIYEILKKTGGKADGGDLVNAAKGLKWESPRGPISIDPETRDIINTVYIRRVERVNGQLQNVEIEKIENVKDPFKARTKH
jgi:branched-chain amino acid transport system substrate-binding protein